MSQGIIKRKPFAIIEKELAMLFMSAKGVHQRGMVISNVIRILLRTLLLLKLGHKLL